MEIERSTTIAGSTAKVLGGYFVVQPSPDWGGDIDGDDTGDPIFQQNGDSVTISLWMMQVDMNGNSHLVPCRITVRVSN